MESYTYQLEGHGGELLGKYERVLVSALTDRFHDHQYLTKDNEYLGEFNL